MIKYDWSIDKGGLLGRLSSDSRKLNRSQQRYLIYEIGGDELPIAECYDYRHADLIVAALQQASLKRPS